MTDGEKSLLQIFQERLQDPTDPSVPVATIQALTEYVGRSQASTMSEFISEVESATCQLLRHTSQCISVAAGCEIFTRFITRTASETTEDFDSFRSNLVQIIKRSFELKSGQCREAIARLAIDFIQDNCTVLIHSYSRVVMMLLIRAAQANRRFRVLVTEARPTARGFKACEELSKYGVPAAVILDAAVGYYIGTADLVLVGAEGVVENGGIINQIGTYQIAVLAKTANVPFYAVAENFKFVRCYPLSQYDLPTMCSALIHSGDMQRPQDSDNACSPVIGNSVDSDNHRVSLIDPNHPTIDYTPPTYITLLFTDVGVLTPSAVSDELIKMYC